jgi:predicted deacylase
MPPSITFQEFTTRFETALAGRPGVRLTRLPNGSPVVRTGSRGPRLAVVAGLHGDETSGPLAMLEWARSAQDPLTAPGMQLWLAPLLNNLGWDAGVREWDGLDLNRSFLPGRGAPAFLRPLLRDWRRRPPDLLLDLHEDAENPGYAYLFRYTEEAHDLPDRMAQGLGIQMLDWTELTEWEGCSELFARGLGVTRCVTLETPTVWPMAQRIACNLQAMDWTIEHVASNRAGQQPA